MNILITGEAPVWFLKSLTELGHQVTVEPVDAFSAEPDLCAAIAPYDILISGGSERITDTVISTASRLKTIIYLGALDGVGVDTASAAEHGVSVFATPGANARSVAEFSLLLMLMAIRKCAQMFDDLAIGVWQAQTGFELQGRTIGLLGSGNVARELSRLLAGFDVHVLYWGPSGRKAYMYGTFADRDRLIEEADILSLHVPYTGTQLLSSAQLRSMKTGSILINTSPAHLVCPVALREVLEEDHLSVAAFDGFYAENGDTWRCPEAKLFALGADKFFVTPHAAWRTRDADKRMYNHALRIVERLYELEME